MLIRTPRAGFAASALLVACACGDPPGPRLDLDGVLRLERQTICEGGRPCYLIESITPAGALRPVPEDLGPADQPAWSPDGLRVAFVRDGALFVRDSSATRTLVPSGVDALTSLGVPQWSADGSTIVYGRGFQNIDGRLCVIGVNGGAERCVGGAGRRYAHPAISPDGRALAAAYDSMHTTAGGSTFLVTVGVAIVDVATGAHTRLRLGGVDEARVQHLAWSPDGARLAFVASEPAVLDEDRPAWAYVASHAGWASRRLTRASRPRLELHPKWSPDGEWIAMSAHPDLNPTARTRNVHVVRVADGSERRVTSGGGARVLDWHR